MNYHCVLIAFYTLNPNNKNYMYFLEKNNCILQMYNIQDYTVAVIKKYM